MANGCQQLMRLLLTMANGEGSDVRHHSNCKNLVLRVLLLSSIMLAVVACASSGPRVESAQPPDKLGGPVLVGTLVDGDGHALPGASATLNVWSELGGFGGEHVVTDGRGRFRIDLPASFVDASPQIRTVGLCGSEGAMAFFDARCALSPGVHDIGDLVFADPADARNLAHLSDASLISRLEFLKHWSSDAFDACLRECGRRGGRSIIAWLIRNENNDDGSTNITVATARNRGVGLADPLVIELVDGNGGEIPCLVGELPVVRVAFVNRDPLKRNLRLECTEPVWHDRSLAVECKAALAVADAFRILRPSHLGARPRGEICELAPGERVVFPIALAHYIMIGSPGRYSCRLAFRMDGSWDVTEDAQDLPYGVLFTYSQPFVIVVAAASGG